VGSSVATFVMPLQSTAVAGPAGGGPGGAQYGGIVMAAMADRAADRVAQQVYLD
jgi:hypothetical protein